MFLRMQNINSTTQFFLEILQRHFTLVTLSTLGMPDHTHQFIENCDVHLHKKSTSSPTSFLRYCKDFANLLFWIIWTGLAMPTKIKGQPVG